MSRLDTPEHERPVLSSGVHAVLIAHVRAQAALDGGELAAKFAAMPDQGLLRSMFSSYRSGDAPAAGSTPVLPRGLKLSKFGLEVMRRYFKSYEVAMPDGERVETRHLLYLDRVATMPYYCSRDGFVFYEHQLAIKLRLADGKIGTLIEIEG